MPHKDTAGIGHHTRLGRIPHLPCRTIKVLDHRQRRLTPPILIQAHPISHPCRHTRHLQQVDAHPYHRVAHELLGIVLFQKHKLLRFLLVVDLFKQRDKERIRIGADRLEPRHNRTRRLTRWPLNDRCSIDLCLARHRLRAAFNRLGQTHAEIQSLPTLAILCRPHRIALITIALNVVMVSKRAGFLTRILRCGCRRQSQPCFHPLTIGEKRNPCLDLPIITLLAHPKRHTKPQRFVSSQTATQTDQRQHQHRKFPLRFHGLFMVVQRRMF